MHTPLADFAAEALWEIAEEAARIGKAVPGARAKVQEIRRKAMTLARADPREWAGARPLKRALQRLVENPLAMRLLEHDFAEGDTVRVDARDGELVFEKAASVAAAARASGVYGNELEGGAARKRLDH